MVAEIHSERGPIPCPWIKCGLSFPNPVQKGFRCFKVPRPILEQTFTNYALPVLSANPVPLNGNLQLTALIDSFAICVPAGSANGVFYGDAQVTITNGLEIAVGTTVSFIIQQTRQLYEVQEPVLKVAESLTCAVVPPKDIPFICWNPSNFYLIASANVTVTVMLFKVPYF
jgi:hypothetical protein